jgi:hypothetical protein
MYKIVNEFPHELILKNNEGPYISIYQPTHRYSPENQQDPIRFKNLIKEVESSLKQEYPKKDIEFIMKPLVSLIEDKEFWNHTYDGIGILSVDGQTIIYNLKREVEELAVVSDSFHIKPLIRNYQSADRYHLLGLNRKEFALFEGNRYGFDKVDLGEGTPTTVEEALGSQFTDPYLTAGSYSGTGGTAMFHGHGGKKDEVEIDTERFFRFVDRLVMERYSNPTGLPLILVALDEYHTLFKNISHNSYLLDKGIKINYDALTIDDLKETAWEQLEPIYLEKTKEIVDKFEISRSQDLGSDDLIQVVKAAYENRIDTILLEADRVIPGKVNLETGIMEEGNLDNPDFDDILDDLAEMVIKSNGKVIILPKERMPSKTGVAASYRF